MADLIDLCIVQADEKFNAAWNNEDGDTQKVLSSMSELIDPEALAFVRALCNKYYWLGRIHRGREIADEQFGPGLGKLSVGSSSGSISKAPPTIFPPTGKANS